MPQIKQCSYPLGWVYPLTEADATDMERAIAGGLPADLAHHLAHVRAHWRGLEEEGAPEGWPPGARHYLLIPVAEDNCPINRVVWRDDEQVAAHPLAPLLDEIWVRQFRRARGIRPSSS